jgi:ribosomal protein S5
MKDELARRRLQPLETRELNLKDQVVSINRVTKVVKGGKNLSFSALVVVGDPDRHVVGFANDRAARQCRDAWPHENGTIADRMHYRV